MALVCASSSSKHKGKGTNENNPAAPFDPKRQRDWTLQETNILIEVVQQYQSTNGVVGFNFSLTVWAHILKKFKVKMPDTIRTKEKLRNRMKVLRERFLICYELVDKRSGGSWDYVRQRSGAPSDDEYEAMVKANGDKANFILPSKKDPSKVYFPWYDQLRTMMGGQTSRGDVSKETWTSDGDSAYHLPATQGSAQPSEQGSSDDPQEFPNDNDVSSPPRRSYSQTTYPMSQSSGSKRKSTDESAGEGNSGRKNKGRSYRERYKKKEDQLHNLFLAGLEIANSIKDENKQDRQEIDDCVTKMNEFGYTSGPAFKFILEEIETMTKRVWFLKATKEMVIKWLNENNIFPNQSQAQNNPFGFTAMLSTNQGIPPYANNPNYGGNNYGGFPPANHANHPNY